MLNLNDVSVLLKKVLAEEGQSPENVSLQKLEKLWQEAKKRKLTKGET